MPQIFSVPSLSVPSFTIEVKVYLGISVPWADVPYSSPSHVRWQFHLNLWVIVAIL